MPVPPTSRYFQVASKARGVPLKCSSGTARQRHRLGRNPQQARDAAPDGPRSASPAPPAAPRRRRGWAAPRAPADRARRSTAQTRNSSDTAGSTARASGSNPSQASGATVGRIEEQPERQQRMRRRRPTGSSQGRVRLLGQSDRQRRRRQRHDDEEQFFHSRSAVSLRVSSESNARWMRSTMMPMTNTPTVRSSRMPASTSSGVEWMSSRPNR